MLCYTYGMDITRTVVLPLESHSALGATLEETRKAYGILSKTCFEEGLTSRYKLHHAGYQAVREATSLTSQMTCSAIRTVAAAYKSAKSNKHVLKAPADFSGETLSLEGGKRGRDFKLNVFKCIVSLSTVQGRLKLPFVMGEHQRQYLEDEVWRVQAAKLVKAKRVKGERFELHVSLVKTVEPTEHVSGGVLGVDTGRRYLAVASTGSDAHFFPAGHLKPKKEHFRRLRGRLDSKGTHSAKRTRKRVATREARLTEDFQHCTAKRLVELAQQKGCGVIAVERLNGIRGRTGARGKKAHYHHTTWAYAQFLQILSDKANAAGISAVAVDPANTSRCCNRCGHTAKENRNGLSFVCQHCGYSLHADLSAARNIRLRAITDGHDLVRDGLQSVSPDAVDVDAKGALSATEVEFTASRQL